MATSDENERDEDWEEYEEFKREQERDELDPRRRANKLQDELDDDSLSADERARLEAELEEVLQEPCENEEGDIVPTADLMEPDLK